MSAAAVAKGDSTIVLSGSVTFPNIVALRARVESLLQAMKGNVKIDFADVSALDSSALSLWLCCLRLAKAQGLSLTAVSVPEQMQQFSSVVGLESEFI